MKAQRLILIPALALGLFMAGTALAQSGSGNLYRVTTKMEMVGMPIQLPAQTVEVCGPKDQASEKMVPHDENCTVSQFQVSGNKSTYTMTCRGENAMTAKGEFERLGPDAYRGKMHMVADSGGDSMEMNATFEGKKIRDCNYATESPEAQGKAMLAKTCEDLLTTPDPAAYLQFTGSAAMCGTYEKRYCDAMLAASLEPAKILAADRLAAQMPAGSPTTWDAFAACGMARPAAITKTCPMAERSNHHEFLVAYCPEGLVRACEKADPAREAEFVVSSCPAQAQAAAARHCAGRDFTALRSSPYGNFCSRFAAGSLQQRNAGAAGANPAPGQARVENEDPPAREEAKKPSWRDRLKSAKDLIGG